MARAKDGRVPFFTEGADGSQEIEPSALVEAVQQVLQLDDPIKRP